jgi:hypothetical protein
MIQDYCEQFLFPQQIDLLAVMRLKMAGRRGSAVLILCPGEESQ